MPVNTGNAAVAVKTTVDVGVVSIGGYFMGMPLQAMILGAMAGALANGMNPPESRRNVALAILVSMILSGAFAPVLAIFLSNYLEFADAQKEMELLEVATPVIIGGGWSWFAPLLANGLKTWWSGLLDKITNKIAEKIPQSGDKS